MLKLFAGHRTTELHVIVVTVVALGLLVILFGGQVNHLVFSCVIAGFGFMILADVVVVWRTLRDALLKNKIKELYIQADKILQDQLDVIHLRLKTIDERLGSIEKRLTGVESNLDKLLKK